MLMYRLFTAIILAAVFLVTLFAASPLIFIGFCLLALVIAAWEWAAFAELLKNYQRVLFVTTNAMLMLLVASATGFLGFSVIEGIHFSLIVVTVY